jgi:hypothetical protein
MKVSVKELGINHHCEIGITKLGTIQEYQEFTFYRGSENPELSGAISYFLQMLLSIGV